jgi:hypothetical protein
MIGGFDHGIVMFNDHDCISRVGERAHDLDETIDVAGVESNRGLIEYEERVDQGSAEAGGEGNAFDFAATEGTSWAIESEIAEADVIEVAESG